MTYCTTFLFLIENLISKSHTQISTDIDVDAVCRRVVSYL